MLVLYYILKLSVGLIIIWLFYLLVLRRLTFYTWNRWYLVVCPALAFLLPLIDIAPVLEKNNWNKTPIVSAIPQIPAYNDTAAIIVPAKSFSEQVIGWLPFLIVAGTIILLIRLLVQYISLLAMRRSSTLLLNGKIRVYQVNKAVIPFSFGNSIFLNQHLHGEEELKEIIRHEFIHVKQRHTFDIIWSEAICILTWYNPFSWLLRKAIRQNLEFIADQQVLKTGLDRREYQYLLLKVIGVPSFSIASNFNFKSLKKRIAMMNKVKSARVHLVRFLLLLPVVAILLVAFRNAAKHRQLPPTQRAATDTIPVRTDFPENVKSFHYGANRVTVTLKDGKEEKYDMNNEKERAAFQKKYGQMPDPPTPPTPPGAPTDDGSLVIVADTVIISTAPPIEPTPPGMPAVAFQDDCYNDKGYCLSVINSPKGQLVLVAGRGKKEVSLVHLDDWKKDKKYEDKYGKLPAGPPSPPDAPVHPPVTVKLGMPAGVSGVHVKDYNAIVKNVDGTVDRYDLRINEDKLKYRKRFGSEAYWDAVKAPVNIATHEPVIMDVAVAAPGKVNHEIIDAISVRAKDAIAHAPAHVEHIVDVVDVADEVLAVITPETTFKQLEQLKTDLQAKGITLTWKDMKATDGKLSMVDGQMSAGNSKNHFRVTDFTKIMLVSKTGHDGKRILSVHTVTVKID